MILVYVGILFAGFVVFRKIVSSKKVSKQTALRLNDSLIEEIETISDTIGVPANIIGAIVVVESGGDVLAVGSAGERGLMQLTEVALKDVNNNSGTNFNFSQMFSSIQNLAAGSLFYELQLSRLKNAEDAIRAYNCGEAGAIGGCGFGYLSLIKAWI